MLVRISDSDIDRIITVLSHSHAQSTWETYGSGLLVFHVFCDACKIPEEQRCPASSVLMLAFIAACSGLYSGKSLENHFYAVRAWHLLHGQPWLVNTDQCTLAISGGKRLTPITSKCKTRTFHHRDTGGHSLNAGPFLTAPCCSLHMSHYLVLCHCSHRRIHSPFSTWF